MDLSPSPSDLVTGLLIFLSLTTTCSALMEGLYCGKQNCYDGQLTKFVFSVSGKIYEALFSYFNWAFILYFIVLGVTRETPKQEISRSYRQLAKKYHPDRYRDEVEKAEASEHFKDIATA